MGYLPSGAVPTITGCYTNKIEILVVKSFLQDYEK